MGSAQSSFAAETNQEGQGAIVPVTPDAMRHLLAWAEAAGITDGSLFRAVLKGGRTGDALDAGKVARIFKAMARAAGLSEGDTARISAIQPASAPPRTCCATASNSPPSCQAGRWKTAEMVGRDTAKQGARAAVRVADRRVPL